MSPIGINAAGSVFEQSGTCEKKARKVLLRSGHRGLMRASTAHRRRRHLVVHLYDSKEEIRRHMNAKQSFVASCLALTCGALIGGESVLSAQGAVVFACANISTGNVRVVFGGSECKPNESPLQWNVAGQPGPAGPLRPPGPRGEAGRERL